MKMKGFNVRRGSGKGVRPLMERAITVCLPLSLYGLCSLVLTYPLIFRINDAVLDPGDPLQACWIWSWEIHKVFAGLKGFFHANILYPHPLTLAYSEHMIGNLPLAGPIILLTHNPILAYNFTLLFTFVFSGFGMYLLCQRLEQSAYASFVAGLIFAFNPFRFGHLTHIDILSMQWFPFLILHWLELIRRGRLRDFLLFTLFFNLQAACTYYLAFMASAAVAILGVLNWLGSKKLPTFRLVVFLVAFIGVTSLLHIPLVLPYFWVRRHLGLGPSLEEIRLQSALLRDYFCVTPLNAFYAKLLDYRLIGRAVGEHALFPGFVGLFLGSFVLLMKFYNRLPRRDHTITNSFLIIMALGFVLSFGVDKYLPSIETRIPMPYSLLYNFVPGFQGLRSPTRFAALIIFGISPLVGYGVDFVQLWARKFATCSIKKALKVGFPFLILLESVSIPLPLVSIPIGESVPEVYHWLALQPPSQVVVELPIPEDIGRSVKAIFVEAPRMYFSTYHWQSLVNGYAAFIPSKHLQLVTTLQNFPNVASLDALEAIGVDYIIVHYDMWPAERQSYILQAVSQSARLKLVRRFKGESVYKLIREVTENG